MSFITTQALALAASADGALGPGNGGVRLAAEKLPTATRRGTTTIAAG